MVTGVQTCALPISSEGVFLASNVTGGSSTTFITDRHFGSASSNRVARVGGGALDGATAGVFDLDADIASSDASRALGARLSF
jgi:hypothetical protein